MRTTHLTRYSIIFALSTLVLFPVFAFANHGDSYSSGSWRGSTSASTDRKIDDLDNDKVEDLRIPILLGVAVSNLQDTWGDARSGGRVHEGIDIFAPRGAYIVSPTDAVVTRIDAGSLGGNVVYTANPGGETFYYAHLEGFADGLDVGDELEAGDLIGYVGNSGNASQASTHLHFTIYGDDGAENPFPRLTEEFDIEERIESIEEILKDADSDDEEDIARDLTLRYRSLFVEAQSEDIDLPASIEDALETGTTVSTVPGTITQVLSRTLTQGMKGADVMWLQTFIIAEDAGVAARALANVGATGNFGPLTKSAITEFQRASGLTPDGVVGPKSRAFIDAAVAK